MSINLAFVSGHLGRDPEFTTSPSGRTCAQFSIASSRRWQTRDGEKKEQTTWHNVVCWQEGLNEKVIRPYLKKGSRVTVVGRIDNRSWDKPEGGKGYISEIVIDAMGGQLELLDKAEKRPGPAEPDSTGAPRQQPAQVSASPQDFDDDIPF